MKIKTNDADITKCKSGLTEVRKEDKGVDEAQRNWSRVQMKADALDRELRTLPDPFNDSALDKHAAGLARLRVLNQWLDSDRSIHLAAERLIAAVCALQEPVRALAQASSAEEGMLFECSFVGDTLNLPDDDIGNRVRLLRILTRQVVSEVELMLSRRIPRVLTFVEKQNQRLSNGVGGWLRVLTMEEMVCGCAQE